ncbi:MAG: tRNA adenosine(34) deaminase TadA [Lachnospiraceae bacterium]|nr:tRNA adenosine(34) deaminase TadA [Lachnospiraceae bacterium]
MKKIMMTTEERYMKEAIRQAKKAAAIGEVPIGCVIEYQGEIIGRGYNRRMADHTVLAHAEIIAIRKACKKMGDWRLEGCTMYITLEPCPMCAGAIVQARIPKVVIGSMNPKAGCAGSVLDMLHEEGFNHQVETTIGVLGENCSAMLSEFFRDLRAKKKKQKELQKAQQALLSDDSSIESTDENAGGNGEKDLQSAADDSGQNKEE